MRDALLSLLVEKGWDELSVQDICARADIGRSTFYLHFPSKEELLIGSLDDLRNVLKSTCASTDTKAKVVQPLAFVRGLLAHIYEQRRLCRSVFGRRSAHAVQVRFRGMVAKLIAENLAVVAPAGWKRDAATSYLAGALVDLLSWWIDSRPMHSIDEVERFYLSLAESAVHELTGRSVSRGSAGPAREVGKSAGAFDALS
ncbi:helix-turn-helix domain containing protein [Cupriavidus basilensis]|uniref:Helix-turn-helix domain containing protein n=1 Tax=Cupriavidus basilensis TaxID=68895 RepID=A0ABT6B4X3_9BURK|nr:TetR/AcrR family transcriptional regulator [Cupriavidus basilensis]MDF3839868.1 helix-turn-helix domain containing protein [Cupriavidus basilensis]